MPKTYVIDTNVLIQSPHSLVSFEEKTTWCCHWSASKSLML